MVSKLIGLRIQAYELRCKKHHGQNYLGKMHKEKKKYIYKMHIQKWKWTYI